MEQVQSEVRKVTRNDYFAPFFGFLLDGPEILRTLCEAQRETIDTAGKNKKQSLTAGAKLTALRVKL